MQCLTPCVLGVVAFSNLIADLVDRLAAVYPFWLCLLGVIVKCKITEIIEPVGIVSIRL